MKICPECNKINPSTFTRCPCGADLSTIKNMDKSEINMKSTKPKEKKTISFFNIIAIFFIIIAITFVVLMIDGVSDNLNKSNTHDDGKCDICGKSSYGYLYGNEYCSKHYEDMK